MHSRTASGDLTDPIDSGVLLHCCPTSVRCSAPTSAVRRGQYTARTDRPSSAPPIHAGYSPKQPMRRPPPPIPKTPFALGLLLMYEHGQGGLPFMIWEAVQ
jgi:hypothetical protein